MCKTKTKKKKKGTMLKINVGKTLFKKNDMPIIVPLKMNVSYSLLNIVLSYRYIYSFIQYLVTLKKMNE